MPRVVSHLLKKKRDDFATVKMQKDGFRAFRKEQDAIPPHPTPPQALSVYNMYCSYYKTYLNAILTFT
jgi:hypothetical protein